MSEKKKRNIVIGTLCGVLLLMVVGYAAFNTLLTINGTASISSNWDIKITNITEGTKVGKASSAEEPTYEDLTATFSTNLVSPGDSIEYNVTVENQGSLNAQLEKININKQISSAINITYSGIEAGETLNSSDSITFTVKVEYNPSITSQPKDTTSTFKMTLDYVEEGKAGETSASTTGTLTMGGQTVTTVTQGDGLYEDPVEPGRYIYKGAKPNNYITFNGETWRIISVETDGTIKIMHQGLVSSAGEMVFDSIGARKTGYCGRGYAAQGGCNAWAKTTNFHDALNQYSGAVDGDSEMKTYLNGTYYNSITKNKTAIQNHIFYYGGAEWANDNLTSQIKIEKEFGVASNVGLIQASDFIKANSNTSSCGTYSKSYSNYETCKNTNYMVNWMSSGSYWMITPCSVIGSNEYVSTATVLVVVDSGIVSNYYVSLTHGLVPSLYLKSDVELDGQGTEEAPYTITNYTD